MKSIAFWLKAARAPFLTGAAVPVFVGISVAWYTTHGVDWPLAGLTLLAMLLLHTSANMSNDYLDHLTGDDAVNTEFVSPFTGGSRVIQQGLVSPRKMLAAALLCTGLASVIGVYLFTVRGPLIIVLGLLGIAGGYFYTAPPFRFAYRGFGELFIGLNFGVLPTVGAAFVQTWADKFRLAFVPALVASIPVALLIIAILWINQFQDMNADAQVGKRNWVVRLGRKRASVVYAVMMLVTYGAIGVGVAVGQLPWQALLGLLALPIAIGGIRTALRCHDDIPRLTPANAATIGAHLATGLLLTIGIALGGRLG